MNASTLPELIDTLVAARRAGGFRYEHQARVLRQFAEHCSREGYADGSIIQEAVEGFLYGRHLKASTIRREEIILRDLAEHALSEMSNRLLVDPVLFRVLYATGLRLSEALNLQLRDVDPARATLEVRDSKNHEHRLVPVTQRLAATLEGYIAAAHPHPEPGHSLFHTGDPFTPADNPRSTTGCAATSPTRTFPISRPAARTSIRCATASPFRTCAAGRPTAPTWW